MNQKELTDEQVAVLGEALHKSLQTIITCPDLFEDVPHFSRRKTEKLTYETEFLNADELGDFKYIIAEYAIGVTVWVQDDLQIVAYVGFHYIHPLGGKNGHQLDLRIQGNLDGTNLVITKKPRDTIKWENENA